MKKHLIFDTETNGLPITHYARYTELNNWPRIAQLSWGQYDDDGNRLKGETRMVKPDGWTVPTTSFFLDNDMSTERCEREGLPLPEVLKPFIEAWNESDVYVCHNASFDRPVLFAELLRYKLKLPRMIPEYCTKLHTEPILKLPGFKGKYKWPSLMEAYQYFFGHGFDGAHDAGADVEACAQVYFKCLEYEQFADLFG